MWQCEGMDRLRLDIHLHAHQAVACTSVHPCRTSTSISQVLCHCHTISSSILCISHRRQNPLILALLTHIRCMDVQAQITHIQEKKSCTSRGTIEAHLIHIQCTHEWIHIHQMCTHTYKNVLKSCRHIQSEACRCKTQCFCPFMKP